MQGDNQGHTSLTQQRMAPVHVQSLAATPELEGASCLAVQKDTGNLRQKEQEGKNPLGL